MKRTFLLVACLGASLLSACGGDSKFPEPTGKGAVRMINAIPGSPQVSFLIEERLLDEVPYKDSSSPATYDDFSYVFNFEIRYPGEFTPARVASVPLTVEADRDHIFLLTGDINAPTVTVWNGNVREWSPTDTVFEARFSHAIASLSDTEIDIYFDAPGTAPGTNPPVATLSYGEIADPAEFEEGAYVITVTDAGDLNTVHFSSAETSLLPRFAHVITVFDGDGNDTAPFAVQTMTSVGNPLTFTDSRFPPQTRFIHAAYTLETVDVYDDELLTSLFASGVAFQGATSFLDTTSDLRTYYFTPAGSQATVLFELENTAQPPGTYRYIYLIGDTDSWLGRQIVPDITSSSLSAKVSIYHAAINFPTFDIYIKDRDEPLVEDDVPVTFAAGGFLNSSIRLAEGSFDMYLTERDTKTEIAAPYPIDVVLGDIVELFVVDTVDPAVVEILAVPTP